MSSFEVFLDDEQSLVRIVATGEFCQSDGENVITTARQTAAEKNYNILYDMRAATTNVAFINWYTMPRNLEVFKNQKAHKIKAAVLASQSDKALDDYRFYEIVTANLGFKLRVFLDEAEAVEWLTAS
jgi:hypothetical protein